MTDPDAHATILRSVAFATVDDARSAWRVAHTSPTEENIRAAYLACVLAARALRRASEVWPDDELAMIEESILLDEAAVTLNAKLVRLAESESLLLG